MDFGQHPFDEPLGPRDIIKLKQMGSAFCTVSSSRVDLPSSHVFVILHVDDVVFSQISEMLWEVKSQTMNYNFCSIELQDATLAPLQSKG